MHKKLIVANWKMNPTTPSRARLVAASIAKTAKKHKAAEVVICPPTVFLSELAKARQRSVALGVQDIFYEEQGAYTGQTSPAMLVSYRARFAILGHSERRALGETNELVGRKVRYAMEQGITPIACVGERERSEDGSYYFFVREELEAILSGLRRKDLAKLVIAYEPIWAIGKRAEEAMQPRELNEMVLFIRKVLTEEFGRKPAGTVRILYGGSVKGDNAHEILEEGGVDGLLVGSASLQPREFAKIIQAVSP
jgi:triosephosphate isomerase